MYIKKIYSVVNLAETDNELDYSLGFSPNTKTLIDSSIDDLHWYNTEEEAMNQYIRNNIPHSKTYLVPIILTSFKIVENE